MIFKLCNRTDNSYLPYLDGENVSRYQLSWNGEYIKYGDNLAAMREAKLFKNPRILVRQIPSKSEYAIEAVYTNDQFINDRNSMIITNINVNAYYLLGIINSRLISLWFLMRYDKFQRRLFPQFKVNELGHFPIPSTSIENQEKIGRLVKELMSETNKDIASAFEIENLNRSIDECVMDLYKLSEGEKQIVREFEI
ncbi:TaqI-like C-terminal specificity domain-containing protein [Lactococcus lactis]|uniref:TaqI-like C-terminal specificity domain-containing protein n=1 Tax=Lactococcus lactis TaxID=1358 RepID=UPI00325CAC20